MPVAYSPYDFFYQAVDTQMHPKKCELLDNTISSIYTLSAENAWPIYCASNNLLQMTPLSTCYKHELCRNTEYTNIIGNTNKNHSGADKRYLDTKALYDMEYLTLGNLSFGVFKLIVVIMLIYYNK